MSPRFVGTLALLGALCWCIWIWFAPAQDAGFSDGRRTLPADTPLRYAAWTDPEPAFERGWPRGPEAHATRSPDGRWLVWAGDTGAVGAGASRDLFVAELGERGAGDPVLLATSCSAGDECSPAFGGEWLYFSSDRAGGAGGHDLWRARFSAGATSAPEPVPGPANTAGEELDPAPLAAQDAIVFVSNRRGGDFDLYSAPLVDGEVERLSSLCSPGLERDPLFTQDERALVFASRRDGGAGGFDLYRAARLDGRFGPLEPLAALNTAQDERAPFAETDDLALGFTRSGADGSSVRLRSTALELFHAPRRAIGWMEWLALAGLFVLALLALLVGRFPELDRIYKCLLVSVIAHLLLLWWFHGVWLSAGTRERERRRDPIRVRLEDQRPPVEVRRPTVEATLELALPALETLPREVERRSERPIAALTTPSLAPEQPRTDPLELRAVESPPSRSRDPQPPVERPLAGTREFVERSGPASAVATPAAELALPELREESVSSADSERPRRLESRSVSISPQPASPSVASRARISEELPERAFSAVDPTPASQHSPALRDISLAASSAGPAAALSLESLEAGTPSPTSRSLGAPSRPDRRRSLGSPAAIPASGSVARAASMDAPNAARSASAALPSASTGSFSEHANAALEGGAAESVARSASPASELQLGDPAAGAGVPSAGTGSSGGPARAGAALGGRSSAPPSILRAEAVAQRASESRSDTASAIPSTGFAPTGGTRTAALAGLELDDGSPEDVSVRASAAPALALALQGEGESNSPESTAQEEAGPSRASSAGPTPGRAISAVPSGPALAVRANGPAASLPRAFGSAGEFAPSPGERWIGLEDTTDSIAQPASVAGSDTDRAWLSGIAPVDAARSDDSGARSGGPARAASPAGTRASEAPESGGASLARAPQRPPDSESHPAKSDWDSTPYQNRSGAQKARALKLYGGSERTEAAVARGLAYLARIQGSDGAWGDVDVLDEKYGRVAVGKTALCTLAFLGAGHTPDSASEYSAVVGRALGFLLGVQQGASGHFGEASAYDHGIATYALAECFALTHDQRLRGALERALGHVLAMQSRRDDGRFRGGWGYFFADGSHYDPWPRTSISAWQVMALESARLSGLDVPDRAFDEARGFFANAHDPELGAYRYNHEPERLRSAYPTLPASTPAALFALALMGEDITGAEYQTARAYVLDRAPDGYRYTGEMDFVRLARGNPYFWYYGTLAMFRVGGSQWQRWNAALQEALLPAQAHDGSWPPIDAYARYARDSATDKSYTTAMCVLSLEIYYRYYLPLLKLR